MARNEKQCVCDHYNRLSSSYDILYSDYNDAVTNMINRQLDFCSEDSILDVGGGTGEIGHRLWAAHDLKTPVVCIDPSPKMLAFAEKKEGVKIVISTAEDYFSSAGERLFDKILVIGCYHHFRDPSAILDGITKLLSKDGVCMVFGVTSQSAPFRFFSKARQLFEDLDISKIRELAESKGLQARVISDCEPGRTTTSDFFEFLRKRGFSVLDQLSDDEIEEGIREIINKEEEEEINVEYWADMCIIKH